LFDNKYLEEFFESNEFNQQLAVGLTDIPVKAKRRMTAIINPLLSNVSTTVQEKYLKLIHTYGSKSETEYLRFAVYNYFEIQTIIKKSSLLKPIIIQLYINIKNGTLDFITWKYATKILLNFRDFLTKDQWRTFISEVIRYIYKDKEFCYEILYNNWNSLIDDEKINDQKKRSLDKMITHIFVSDEEKEKAIILKIRDDFKSLTTNDKKAYIKNFLIKFNKKQQLQFVNKLLSELSNSINESNKKHLVNAFVKNIKATPQIDIKRRYLNALCIFKTTEFRKDLNVFNLFNYLFSGKKEYVKLALEFYKRYYEDKIPYRKKTELIGLLQNIIDNEKRNIKQEAIQLARDLKLKIKRNAKI
jgi:hypothetical protein